MVNKLTYEKEIAATIEQAVLAEAFLWIT